MVHPYEQNEGLTLVSPASADARVNVVFVHGLGGGAYSTWNCVGNDGMGYWPKLIAREHPRCAVWTVQYTAHFFDWPFSRARTLDFMDRAAWLLNCLSEKGIHSKPIVFVAHSLGGVLVKQALQFAQFLGSREWRPIWNQTVAILFLATPHEGASIADAATRLADVVGGRRWFLRLLLTPSPALRNLAKNNPPLRFLGNWYEEYVPRHGIKTITFAERRPIAGCMIVDAGSANPHIRGSVPIPLADETHITIAKPSRRDHPVFNRLSQLLKEAESRDAVPPVGVDDQTTLDLRAEMQRLVDRLRGDWWELHLDKDPVRISVFTIDRDGLFDSIRLSGDEYNAEGRHVSRFWSVVAQTKLERQHNQVSVNYAWEGEYISSEASRGDLRFSGIGLFRFEMANGSSESITQGHGRYFNVDESEPSKTETRRVNLWRASEPLIVTKMRGETQSERSARFSGFLNGQR